MTLREYLSTNRLTLAQFAKLVGAHPITVHEWVAGKVVPRRASMAAIEEATGGQVQPASFYASPASTEAA
jgi:DNA-binding transcriptional regulator YdaS (Cro superfamily)